MVETHPGSNSSSSFITTRPISSTSARGILANRSRISGLNHAHIRGGHALLHKVLPQPNRNLHPALSQPLVLMLPAAYPPCLSRLLLDLNDLALRLDLLALDSVVNLEVVERAKVEVVKATGSGRADAIDRREQGEGLEAFGSLDRL